MPDEVSGGAEQNDPSNPWPRALAATARITFEGRPLDAVPGESIAAALAASGEYGLREAGPADRRGVFCGMGVCHECLVTVDGVPGQRACMRPVRDGMSVGRHPARPQLGPETPALPHRELEPDLLVVGAGAGGLSAAAAAAELGASVIVLDERRHPGGQYFKQLVPGLGVPVSDQDAQHQAGRALIDRALAAGVEILGDTEAWGAFAPTEIRAVRAGEESLTLRPRRLVLATGGYERGVPVPGWTLPGFFTTGAVQTFLRSYHVRPGHRMAVAGNGPLNLQVAAELVRAGVEVSVVAELGRPTSPRRGLDVARMALLSPRLARQGAGYLATLTRARVPRLYGSTVIRAAGDGRVQSVTTASVDADGQAVAGTEQEWEVDAVCVGHGFLPSHELARQLGLDHTYDRARKELSTVRDHRGKTGAEHVWVVGDGGGIDGAPLAQAMGTLAGLDIARSLGASMSGARSREAAAERSARTHGRFQERLRRLYAAPDLGLALAAPDTVVCRCEGITRAELVEAHGRTGAPQLGSVKRATRAGMGRCQGRYCGPLLAQLIATRDGVEPDDRSGFAPRAPAKPVLVGQLARKEQERPTSR